MVFKINTFIDYWSKEILPFALSDIFVISLDIFVGSVIV